MTTTSTISGPALEAVDPHAVTISASSSTPPTAQPPTSTPSQTSNKKSPPQASSLHPWPLPRGLPLPPLDHASVRGLWLRRRHQRTLQVPPRSRQNLHQSQHRPLHRVRSPNAHGPRTRTTRSPPARSASCGVAIDTIEDMHRLYADIPLEDVTVSQTINGPAAVIWAMYLAMARAARLQLGRPGRHAPERHPQEFHAQNEFIYPPEASVKLVVDTIEFQTQHVPASGTASPSAATTSARRARPRPRSWPSRCATGWSTSSRANQARPRRRRLRAAPLSFFFNAHNEFFEEICKLRAARRIWATRMKRPFYGAKSTSAPMCTCARTCRPPGAR